MTIIKVLSFKRLTCPVATVATLALALPCLAQNPIVQTIYTADPAPIVHNGTVYLYTGHDEDGSSSSFVMKDWHCYSSQDMVNWTDLGSPLSLKNFAWAASDAWAGQCIERNGKFYYYVPITRKEGGIAIGVAVSDSPTGPFKDPLGKPLAFDGWGDIDPTVFVDDDGQAYLAWGNPTYKYVKLNKDMISYDTSIGDKGIVRGPMTVEAFGKRASADRPTAYEEGPWLYKRQGLYYLIYAGGPVPEHLAYATSSKPTGPWAYGGTIMPTQGASFTNHPGVIDFKGHTYLFYHNGALPGGGGFTRSVCVDELKFKPDGSIQQLNMTKEGPGPVATLNPYARTEAETIAWESGIRTEPCSSGGVNVTDIDDGDYIRVRNLDFQAVGASTFVARVASTSKPKASRGGAIELHLDAVDGPLIGTARIGYTGGAGRWKEVAASVSGAKGVHDLCLVFRREATGVPFQFDSWRFHKKTALPQLLAISAAIDRYKIDTASGANRSSLKVTAIFSDGRSKDVTGDARIVSIESGIASVEKGVVTGTSFGTTELSVSYRGKTDTVAVMVKDLKTEFIVRKLTTSITDAKLLNGGRSPFVVTAEYLDGHTEDVTKAAYYAVADANVATVQNGVITAMARGTSAISVSFRGEMGDAATAPINVAVANRDPFSLNEAEEFNEQSGLVIENCSEGGRNLCDASNGEWFKFNALDFGSGAKSFSIRAASDTNGGNMEIVLDNPAGPVVGTVQIPKTGGWQNWVTRNCELKGVSGMHDVYFRFTGGPGILFNVNWWKFEK